MGETVRRILADNPAMQPGDVFVTNDPYRGGSHLPDITVVTPVHRRRGSAAVLHRQPRPSRRDRRHHARLDAAVLEESGRRRRADSQFQAGRRGAARGSTSCARCLLSGQYPTRAVADNLADVAAQVAANHQGARDLLGSSSEHSLAGRGGLHAAHPGRGRAEDAAALATAAAGPARVRRSSRRRLADRRRRSPIAGDRATIDFTGTGPVLAGNLNANRAIVTAAVMYCAAAA